MASGNTSWASSLPRSAKIPRIVTRPVRIPSVHVPEVEVSAAQLRAINNAAKAIERLDTPEMRKTLEEIARTAQSVRQNLPQEQIQAAEELLSVLNSLRNNIVHQDFEAVQAGLDALEEAEKEENAWEQIEAGLRDKLEDGVAHVNRAEIEDLGEKAGLSRRAAVQLFEDQKDLSWRGDYVVADEVGWIAAWIEEI